MVICSDINTYKGGRGGETGRKWKIVTVPRGKISFWKKGMGQKYHILGQVTPLNIMIFPVVVQHAQTIHINNLTANLNYHVMAAADNTPVVRIFRILKSNPGGVNYLKRS